MESQPAVFSIDAALAGSLPIIWGTDNILEVRLVSRGDVEAASFAGGAIVVEGEHETGAQEQLLYRAQRCMVAVASPEDGVTVCDRYSARITSTTRWRCAFRHARPTRFGSCRWRRVAASAAKKSIQR